jgi:hypothetical protein
MTDVLLTLLRSIVKTRAALQIEIVALRHQVNVLRRSVPNRPRLRPSDRLFWTRLSRVWPDWRSALVLVKPETVVAKWIRSDCGNSPLRVSKHKSKGSNLRFEASRKLSALSRLQSRGAKLLRRNASAGLLPNAKRKLHA